MLIATNQCHNEEATAETRKHKRELAALAFLRVPPANTVTSGRQPSDPPSISSTPETLPRTALLHLPLLVFQRAFSDIHVAFNVLSRAPYLPHDVMLECHSWVPWWGAIVV